MIRTALVRLRQSWVNISLLALAFLLLALTYLFQRVNFFSFFTTLFGSAPWPDSYIPFIFNKTLRLVINDVACFIMIYVFFRERKYLTVAFWVFLFEVIVLLPGYFILKLSLEGDSEISSPLLSQIHRLIINPTLMILLIVGFFYQRFVARKAHE